jgi:hypothetical protein
VPIHEQSRRYVFDEARMDIRPILTDDDHRRALAEIEQLWGAADGTPQGEKLDNPCDVG